MKSIKEYIEEYDKQGIYPFHMPGHKRQLDNQNPLQAGFFYDYTEITGFDNLHEPQGILKELQERASNLYGAKQSYVLVNGSSCGILAAISACCQAGDTILLDRGSHKAAYHAAYLRNVKVKYLYPKFLKEGIAGSIDPKQVEEMLSKHPQIKAVFITSPTYDGITSDIKTIAKIVHAYEAVLIVDEAHGAHFGFHPDFPDTAVHQGADLVIQSMHKTLRTYTQSALLHRGSDRISDDRIMRYLDIYETSSPSYLLMASMDECLGELKAKSREIFEAFSGKLHEFYKSIDNQERVRAYKPQQGEVFGKDPSKILIYDAAGRVGGRQLFDWLRDKYQLELEMCAGNFATALSTYCDSTNGFMRLSAALKSIEHNLQTQTNHKENRSAKTLEQLYHQKEQVMQSQETEKHKTCQIPFSDCADKISADYMYLYPPGIPFIVPGERISKDVLKNLTNLTKEGYVIEGLSDRTKKTVKVIRENG
ncbi:aminotransferase class I/II-fold pyridoxal phosphate-dependent enzyme [Eubacterium oxidoreducens]|uniref:Arginine/lysine/ornithine decarboxylase n=1 Tax=Eubacterium oxidoreducens TaxID=1732 RepID=A0A1G5ZZJ9_EUBOX|nr:aminotransferase class I/II-fold pyridoxal phosphate-dependent enzyme [Eubacterium oxidoreducens]SDB01639.1 Arginine/lysine/ornithine decarboxylase [Eubacterium oxidoreducens]